MEEGVWEEEEGRHCAVLFLCASVLVCTGIPYVDCGRSTIEVFEEYIMESSEVYLKVRSLLRASNQFAFTPTRMSISLQY